MRLRNLILITIAALALALRTPAQTTRPAFVIGVFEPDDLHDGQFTQWKQRGINTVVGVPQGHDTNRWSYYSFIQGLWQIRSHAGGVSAADFAADAAGTPNLYAWMTVAGAGDECDLKGIPPATVRAEYNALKAADPKHPVYANFAGGCVLHMQGNVTAAQYAEYEAATDISASDVYPVTGWGLPNKLNLPALAVDELRMIDPTRPQWAYIETSNQRLSWVPNDSGVTADQFNVEVYDALIHGASGIVYFPEVIGAWSFDGTPPAVVTAMTAIDANISGPWLPFLTSNTRKSIDTGNANVDQATWKAGEKTLTLTCNWSQMQQLSHGVTYPPLAVSAQISATSSSPAVTPAAVHSVTIDGVQYVPKQ